MKSEKEKVRRFQAENLSRAHIYIMLYASVFLILIISLVREIRALINPSTFHHRRFGEWSSFSKFKIRADSYPVSRLTSQAVPKAQHFSLLTFPFSLSKQSKS